MSMTEKKDVDVVVFPEVPPIHCPNCLEAMVPIKSVICKGDIIGTVVFIHPHALRRRSRRDSSTPPRAECGLLDAEFSVIVATKFGTPGKGRS